MKLNKKIYQFLEKNIIKLSCILVVIGVLIYLIVLVRENQENYKNNHNYNNKKTNNLNLNHNRNRKNKNKNNTETFKNGKYDSHKCDIDTRGLKKDNLYEKVKNVDIVYMWVDGSDKKWQESMKSNVSSRNRSNNEIIYSYVHCINLCLGMRVAYSLLLQIKHQKVLILYKESTNNP
jgi:hypothetical protein